MKSNHARKAALYSYVTVHVIEKKQAQVRSDSRSNGEHPLTETADASSYLPNQFKKAGFEVVSTQLI